MSDPWPRFWQKVHKTDDCWLWTGGRSTVGYGLFWMDGRMRTAHRWIWEREKGPVPKGLELDHLCCTRRCVRPSHLEAVTHSVNLFRSEAVKAWGIRRTATALSATHCIHGHAKTPENTYVSPDGAHRQCKTCHGGWTTHKERSP